MVRKLAATYSVIAYDRNQMGATVQSHFFGVGSVVPWARAGVGVVCTQSIVNVDAGPQILALLELGAPAHDALSMVVAADAERDYRQIAVLGATGSIAAHTGSKAIAHAGHVETATGSFQANMMANPGVPEAMEAAFTAADGPLCGVNCCCGSSRPGCLHFPIPYGNNSKKHSRFDFCRHVTYAAQREYTATYRALGDRDPGGARYRAALVGRARCVRRCFRAHDLEPYVAVECRPPLGWVSGNTGAGAPPPARPGNRHAHHRCRVRR